jgi:hypothetical protein
VVFVDQAAEQVLSANVSRAHGHRGLVFRHRCREGESAMRPPAVVVLGIRAEHPIEMPPTEDERRVDALGETERAVAIMEQKLRSTPLGWGWR